MTNQTVLVLDFGGKTKENVAKMIRECRVYSRIVAFDIPTEEIKAVNPIGLVLVGDSADVNDSASPKCRPELFELNIPVLGIGYGMHAMTYALMGRVESRKKDENGRVKGLVDVTCPLFADMASDQTMYMSHAQDVTILPRGFENYARTAACPNAVMGDPRRGFFGLQFHPELDMQTNGLRIINNFLYRVCRAVGDYDIEGFADDRISRIRERVGNDRIILAVSGGIESAVCAALLMKAVPNQVCCIFVDHGFLRENEAESIENSFKAAGIDITRIDAAESFVAAVSGITDPEEKRRRMDKTYYDVVRSAARSMGDVRYLAKATSYSEQSAVSADGVFGFFTDDVGFRGVIEPLRELFVDEIRALGRVIGLSKLMLGRQSSNAMGLASRIIGEVTPEKLDILRRADAIFRTELQKTRCQTVCHYAVLCDVNPTNEKSEYSIALRSVSVGGYTEIPHRTLSRISARITDEIGEISHVVYDITHPGNE
ncbi:MAG: hypothetical protein IJD17_05060 [Clostridia bacterium]|nr:hypothetical protein [Clostridia bacterium]